MATSGLVQFFVAQVGSAIYGLGISPKNVKYFQFFSLRIKKNVFGPGQKVPRSKLG